MLNLVTESEVVTPKPKNSMLPILVVLFVVSYGMMTMLIVEQGRTIDTQRFLIRQLFNDTAQLTALRNGTVARPGQAQGKTHGRTQTPPSQAAPAEKSKGNGSASKIRQQESLKPPTAASDTADERRSLVTI